MTIKLNMIMKEINEEALIKLAEKSWKEYKEANKPAKADKLAPAFGIAFAMGILQSLSEQNA